MAAGLLSRLTSSLGDEHLQLNPANEDTAEKMTNDAARIRLWWERNHASLRFEKDDSQRTALPDNDKRGAVGIPFF